MPPAKPVLERLEARSTEEPHQVEGLDMPCWVWGGSTTKQGYGIIKYLGKNAGTHRVAYLEMRGEIPESLEPDHLCRRRDCWNPWHIDLVTHAVNVKRSRAGDVVRARAALITKCPQGHPYTEKRTSQGKRRCNVCAREKARVKSKAAGAGPAMADRTHCPQDHPLSGDNLYVAPKTGCRHCRECRKAQMQAYYGRQAARKTQPPA